MYKSPITVLQERIQIQMDELIESQILKAVQNVGVVVEKDELLKALKYDRGQYDKGWKECKAIYEEKFERIIERLERLRNYELAQDCPKDGMCDGLFCDKCTTCYTDTAIEIVKDEVG